MLRAVPPSPSPSPSHNTMQTDAHISNGDPIIKQKEITDNIKITLTTKLCLLSIKKDQIQTHVIKSLLEDKTVIFEDFFYESEIGRLIVIAGKVVYLYQLDVESGAVEFLAQGLFPKRLSGCLIQENVILLSDRCGNVYRQDMDELVANFAEKGEEVAVTDDSLFLGHYSWITTLNYYDGFIFTGDKTDKIRISYYPDGFDIHGYCLGHRNAVTCVLFSDGQFPTEWMISGGGDGSIRIWDYKNCKEISNFTIEGEAIIIRKIVCSGNKLYAIVDGQNTLYHFDLTEDHKIENMQTTLLNDTPYALAFDNANVLNIGVGNRYFTYQNGELVPSELNESLEQFLPEGPVSAESKLGLSMKVLIDLYQDNDKSAPKRKNKKRKKN
eukprot:TRINITY_DN3155_c0_g2_i1.p1 TRINITY_DN3155_c0_g2~~TRINITY_DN3155_c0_g2_i1.p1  ORF type:complete len:383 (+),score=83.14 TRINITY_DN3155_c0_g2_i1:312-1460(+)